MSTTKRFNRNDAQVPNDRLFPDDFIKDQNAQDEDIFQLVEDLGCIPCVGSGLDVTVLSHGDNTVNVAVGWGRQKQTLPGKRATVATIQTIILTHTNGADNFLVLRHKFTDSDSRPAHKGGVVYNTRRADDFEIVIIDAWDEDEITLANCVKSGGVITIDITKRTLTSCKLLSQTALGGGPEETAQKSNQEKVLADYHENRQIPMPIILKCQTVLTEQVGLTTSAVAAVPLPNIGLQLVTPQADVRVWIGDYGTGIRDTGNIKKINFTQGTLASGETGWDDDLWITDPPGFYYCSNLDGSWVSKITANGALSVMCEDDAPAGSQTFYIGTMAPGHLIDAIPYEDQGENEVLIGWAKVSRKYKYQLNSPCQITVTIHNLNYGAKYKIKVASVITSDINTLWAEQDFVVGEDLNVCYEGDEGNITLTEKETGIQVEFTHPENKQKPDAVHLCYTVVDPNDPNPTSPSFDDLTHEKKLIVGETYFIKAPIGKKVLPKFRYIYNRRLSLCSSVIKEVPIATGAIVGGKALISNVKVLPAVRFHPDAALAQNAYRTMIVALPNPVLIRYITIQNLATATLADMEFWFREPTAAVNSGQLFKIGANGDIDQLAKDAYHEKEFDQFKIQQLYLAFDGKNVGSSQTPIVGITIKYTDI